MKNCLKLLILLMVSLFQVQKGHAFEESYTLYAPASVHDKWWGSYYYRNGVNNDVLKVGGWGDHYFTIIRMPISVSVPPRILVTGAKLHLYSFGSKNPTSMRKLFVRDPWIQSSTTDHLTVRGWDQGSILAPPETGEYVIDISAEFGAWYNGEYPNYGIALTPEYNDNRFNTFLSSENGRGYGKPRIVVNYEKLPDFKMPLPGGIAWRLTVEAGGKQFDEQTEKDEYHDEDTLYSLDFNREWVNLGGGSFSVANDIPIYAAAAGVIISNAYSSANGWFVMIDHDSDGKVGTGFQTRYLHFNEASPIAVGTYVRQGHKIGVMGDGGISEGIHLHMTFLYKGKGGNALSDYDSRALNALTMEGRPIRNYKLGTTWNSTVNRWTPYYAYPSSNTVDLE